jgi:formate dehydrogenase gamma subunit
LALVLALAAARAGEDCLSCHTPASGLTNSRGKNITVNAAAVQKSVHKALQCTDCHAGAAKFPHTAKTASASCLTCHAEVSGDLSSGAHSMLGNPESSQTCITCHGGHNVMQPSARGTQFCASCHAAEVKEFAASVHGRAQGRGNGDAPSCTDCHGPTHRAAPASDPRSTIAKANLPQTCGKCHPDAGKRFAIGSVHVVATGRGGNRALYYVRLFYLFTIPTTIGLMLLHNFLDWWRKARRRLAEYRSLSTAVRLTLNERLQHVLLLVSFILLVVTGFALKFPESFWAAPLVKWEKNFPLRGLIHRIAAVVLMGAAVYHVIYLAVVRDGRRWLRGMLPKVKDVRDAIEAVGYNLGYRRRMPSYPRFNYAEKAEYWALVWGTVVMAITGIVLWAHNFVLKYFSTSWIDVATAIHYYEALLATLAIVVWYFYAVIFDPDVYPLKWTFLTGQAPAHEVREEAVETVLAAGADEPRGGVTPSASGNGPNGEVGSTPASSAGNKDVD